MTDGEPTAPASVATAGSAPSVEALSDEDRQRTLEVLRLEYDLLMKGLSVTWTVSMSRTSVFLGVLSAAGVALGFAVRDAGFGSTFFALALVILPITLFIGLASFVRQVQIAREVVVALVGMSRIRHFLQEHAPASRPYFVLSPYDDELSLRRNFGAGMSRQPPRWRLLFALVQSPGVVAVLCGVIAGAIAACTAGALALEPVWAWLAAGAVFLVVAGSLLAYWQASMADLDASIRPIFPTPPEEVAAPF